MLLDTVNLANSNLESEDILGDAYQYLIKQFADEEGKKGGNFKNISLFGQEINLSTWAICKMNMLFHGAKGADIQKGEDTRFYS